MASAADLAKKIKRLWSQGTDTALKPDVEIDFLKDAIDHVEALDYPNSNTYSDVSGDSYMFEFDTTPSAASELLYVYKALEFIQLSRIGKQILSEGLGISFKSGIDSISTIQAAKENGVRLTNFAELYENALNKAVQNNESPITIIDLYAV